MFSGRYDHAIDDKGRVSIPVRFREELDRDGHDRLYITNFIFEGHRCLEVYPPNEWSRLQDQIRQRARFDREVRAFELFYIGGAHEVLVDKQGRILVPPKLREFAALKGDVTFSALTDHFQLWDKAALEEVLKATEQRFSDPDFFQKLGL
ncbi:MAG TPA: division/cell wall cluster transcriptional repressor MraZ [Candidatus Binataceae bacterium]|nr:division/cell wall cluster transcriptional repressor MraZ [Candidatus Binataceae bacterium]